MHIRFFLENLNGKDNSKNLGVNHQQQHYSPWWAMDYFTALLQPVLSSTLPLQSLISITTRSITTLSNHLVRGRPLPRRQWGTIRILKSILKKQDGRAWTSVSGEAQTTGSCARGNESCSSIKNAGNFLTSWVTISFSRRPVTDVGIYLVSQFAKKKQWTLTVRSTGLVHKTKSNFLSDAMIEHADLRHVTMSIFIPACVVCSSGSSSPRILRSRCLYV
jgi:hypothetical protein